MGANRRSRDAVKEQTRAALLQAGLAEFVEHGLDTPSLDAICARAGFTRGAFYVHFRDRDAFVVAVMESILGDFLDAIIAGGEQASGLEETIVRFAGALAQGNPLTGARGSMRTHQLIDVCVRSEKIRARFVDLLAEAQRRVARAAASGQKAGVIRPDITAETIGLVLVVLAMGVVQTFELGMPLELDALRETALKLLAPPGPAGADDQASGKRAADSKPRRSSAPRVRRGK